MAFVGSGYLRFRVLLATGWELRLAAIPATRLVFDGPASASVITAALSIAFLRLYTCP
jgi:hypothetical protein